MDTMETQYGTSARLNTRISIHDKYSQNPQSFGDWIYSHYDLRPGNQILELGCGTGRMWQGKALPEGARLILTDLSQGMLEAAQAALSGMEHISFRQTDIQDIPFPDRSFDVVIANMMLYHVPDLRKGLSEVRRVLKPGGCFYCATYGIHGILEYANQLLGDLQVHGDLSTAFTLQNGGELLARHFETVTRFDREDGLAVTNLDDFADYLYSLSGLANIETVPRDMLLDILKQRTEGGILYVPKEYGMFLCN